LIPILLDPWLVTFSSADSNDDLNAKMGPLKRVFDELQKEYPLEVVRFIAPEEYAGFWNEFPKCRFVADKMSVIRFINRLSMSNTPQVEPARITDMPCPTLPEPWLKVLADNGNTDTPPKWRYPMVLLPDIRKSNWPRVDEINYTHGDSPKQRNLVPIERHQDHKFFISDISPRDPWRLECVGLPISYDGSLEQKRNTWRRLPCPPELVGARTLQELFERLQERFAFTTTDANFYYVPPQEWNPLNINRQSWRDGSFPKVLIRLGPRAGKSGQRDRDGRIWVWHDEECHWDVQINEGACHINVSHTGRNLSV
jgi:hypothetical protein